MIFHQYKRPVSLGRARLRELDKIDIGHPKHCDTLEELSREQLRTAVILYALRRAKRKVLGDGFKGRDLEFLIKCEEQVRIEQLTREGILKHKGIFS